MSAATQKSGSISVSSLVTALTLIICVLLMPANSLLAKAVKWV